MIRRKQKVNWGERNSGHKEEERRRPLTGNEQWNNAINGNHCEASQVKTEREPIGSQLTGI